MRRLAAELFREVGVRPLENTREAAMVERFYCSRLYLTGGGILGLIDIIPQLVYVVVSWKF